MAGLFGLDPYSSAAMIGLGGNLLFGDSPSQPGPMNVGNMGGAYGQMMTTAGQPGLGLWNQNLQNMPTFNQDSFQSQTGDIYGMMQELMGPEQDRLRQQTQEQLFSQGRLGSTGGALQQQAMEEAIQTQNMQNMLAAMGQAQGLQQQEYNQWLGSTNLLGNQAMGMFSQIAPYQNFQEGWGRYEPNGPNPWDIWGGNFNKPPEEQPTTNNILYSEG